MRTAFEIIAQGLNQIGESPLWSAAEQCLYWVDISAKKVFRWHASTGIASWDTPQMAACILPHADTGLLLFQENQIAQLRIDHPQCSLQTLSSFTHPHAGLRFNDGCIDRQGRAWIGSMRCNNDGQLLGSLYCYQQVLQPHLHALATPNGLAFSPDGRTMYLSDSHPQVQKIWAFDYDIHAGLPFNRRLFVDMQQHAGRPDGATVDTDGCYWICAIDAGRILRFSPQGVLLMHYQLPISKPSKCCFGGADMQTLFVTSLHADAGNPLDGSVLAIRTPYQGVIDSEVAH